LLDFPKIKSKIIIESTQKGGEMVKVKYNPTYISPHHQALIEEMMKETGKSASEIVREALNKFFHNDPPKENN
jgi:hypothetical protein